MVGKPFPPGENHPRSKLSAATVRRLRRAIARGDYGIREAARRLSVERTTIDRAVHKRSYRNV